MALSLGAVLAIAAGALALVAIGILLLLRSNRQTAVRQGAAGR
jgi:hypothetical protein